MKLSLRRSIPTDLEIFYLNQTDEEANHMAAFTPKDPFNKKAYLEKWTKLLDREDIHMQTITVKDQVIGCVVKFVMEGDAEITYAISKEFWGQGITSEALKEFLKIEKGRPIFGRVTFDNYASQKVLEKAGFEKIGIDRGFANARNKEIEESIYRLSK